LTLVSAGSPIPDLIAASHRYRSACPTVRGSAHASNVTSRFALLMTMNRLLIRWVLLEAFGFDARSYNSGGEFLAD
jgi:hypothetical protein